MDAADSKVILQRLVDDEDDEADKEAEERYWRETMERFKASDVPWIDPTKAIPWTVETIIYRPSESSSG
jgi:hypothetical protein